MLADGCCGGGESRKRIREGRHGGGRIGAERVGRRNPLRVVIREPALAGRVLRRERLQRQVDAARLIRLHERRAGLRVAEDEEQRRAQCHPDGRRARRVIDTCEDGDALAFERLFEAVDRRRRRVTASDGDEPVFLHRVRL